MCIGLDDGGTKNPPFCVGVQSDFAEKLLISFHHVAAQYSFLSNGTSVTLKGGYSGIETERYEVCRKVWVTARAWVIVMVSPIPKISQSHD